MNKLAVIIYNYLVERDIEQNDDYIKFMANELAEIITEYIQIEINHALKIKEK